MGDRSQIAVKHPTDKDPNAKVYLYSHWAGSDAFKALQKVIKAGARLDDPEYFTRIVFREIGAGVDGETGFGIGTCAHEDIQYLIPVCDCETQTISFEIPEWDHNKRPDPGAMTFAQFAALPSATIESL